MPIKTDREYRSMMMSVRLDQERQKLIDSDFYVEGYATTFNDPYLLYEDPYDGRRYYESIDRGAIDGADVSDVIFQYNHAGRVFARNKNGTLCLTTDDHGLRIGADLGKTEAAREIYTDISAGMVDQMSWAFIVDKDEYESDGKQTTRHILRIKKVFDVSAVSIPANPGTEIYTRGWVDGAIESAKMERLKRERDKRKLEILLMIGGVKR